MPLIRANVAQYLVSSIKGASINALTVHKVIVIVLKFISRRALFFHRKNQKAVNTFKIVEINCLKIF